MPCLDQRISMDGDSLMRQDMRLGDIKMKSVFVVNFFCFTNSLQDIQKLENK